jgi:hypothetical protein
MPSPRPDDPTVPDLVLAFKRHAQGHYRRPDGTTTNEVNEYRHACPPLLRLYADSPAAGFGPLALSAVRDAMVGLGWCRTRVNRQVGRVKRVFRWDVGRELVPAAEEAGLHRDRGGCRWLDGGDGDDRLKGDGGHDVLLGGAGADRIVGNADDILIAGATPFDASPAALCAAIDEWTRADKTAEQRVDHLRNGTGYNGSVRLDASSLFSDADADVLTGGSGYDWFVFDSVRDRVTDLNDEAYTDDLPFVDG